MIPPPCECLSFSFVSGSAVVLISFSWSFSICLFLLSPALPLSSFLSRGLFLSVFFFCLRLCRCPHFFLVVFFYLSFSFVSGSAVVLISFSWSFSICLFLLSPALPLSSFLSRSLFLSVFFFCLRLCRCPHFFLVVFFYLSFSFVSGSAVVLISLS